MTKEELLEIFKDDSIESDLLKGPCNALRGLNLIAKYLPNSSVGYICANYSINIQSFLVFPTKEIRDKFLQLHHDLILEAKSLL